MFTETIFLYCGEIHIDGGAVAPSVVYAGVRFKFRAKTVEEKRTARAVFQMWPRSTGFRAFFVYTVQGIVLLG